MKNLWWALIAFVLVPYSLDTDVEDLKEQESVSRILAELLENQEDFFDTEEDDISTTNDYSSINEQVHMTTLPTQSPEFTTPYW